MNLPPASWDVHKAPIERRGWWVSVLRGFMGSGRAQVNNEFLAGLRMDLAFPSLLQRLFPQTGEHQAGLLPCLCCVRINEGPSPRSCQHRHVHPIKGCRNLAQQSQGVFQSHPKVFLLGFISQFCPVNEDYRAKLICLFGVCLCVCVSALGWTWWGKLWVHKSWGLESCVCPGSRNGLDCGTEVPLSSEVPLSPCLSDTQGLLWG